MLRVKTSLIFHDRRTLNEIRKRNVKALFRAGGYVRTVARRSITKRGRKRSKPGQKPVDQTKTLKHNLYFWVDRRDEVAIVGASVLHKGGKGVDALEVGGTAHYGKGGPMEARPFMEPALTTSEPKLREMWSNI